MGKMSGKNDQLHNFYSHVLSNYLKFSLQLLIANFRAGMSFRRNKNKMRYWYPDLIEQQITHNITI